MKKLKEKLEKTTRKWCRKDRNELYVSGHPRRRTSENVVGKRRAWREEGGEKTSATKREGALETCLKSSSHTARNSIYL